MGYKSQVINTEYGLFISKGSFETCCRIRFRVFNSNVYTELFPVIVADSLIIHKVIELNSTIALFIHTKIAII